MKLLENIKFFFNERIWQRDLSNEKSKNKRFLFKQLRVLYLAAKGYNENKVQSQASALTFYTLLSIVPVIAMAFGIAKGFGFQEKLEQELLTKAGTNNTVVWEKLIDFSENLLANTKGGILAGIGIVVLFWSVMKLLMSIETSFNDIWGIKTGRTWIRKFTDYLTIMLISPILILLSSSVTVFIKSQFEQLAESFELIGFLGPVVNLLFRLSPYILIWATFSLLYAVMPNTRVKTSSAITAGIVAGTLFQFFEWGYISLQIGVARANAIYGSFAALPLFLIWLQTSWLIVLMGAEIAFANQNIDHFEQELGKEQLSQTQTKKISILLLSRMFERFENGKKAFSTMEWAQQLDLSMRLLQPVVFLLKELKLVNEIIAENAAGPGLQPSRDLSNMTYQEIIDAIDNYDTDPLEINDELFEKLESQYDELRSEKLISNKNVKIAELYKH